MKIKKIIINIYIVYSMYIFSVVNPNQEYHIPYARGLNKIVVLETGIP